MKELTQLIRRTVAAGCLFAATAAFAGANPSISWNYGTITATPQYPIVGESAHIAVVVGNSGPDTATGVQVKISFNDWGVTFQGWQEIATVTIPSIPAGGTVLAETDYVFQNRTHTCVEAVVVGSSDNSDPNDDRGQINLEVINSGETFSWNVPVVNNGDQPLNLLLVGGCKHGPDGAAGNEGHPCDMRPKEVVVAPGEEILVPVEIDLRGFAVGQQLEFELTAYDLGAGPEAFLPQNRNHVLLRIIRETAKHLEDGARTQAATIAGTQTDKGAKKRIQEVAKLIEKATSPDLWIDANRVKKGGGASVFAHSQAAVNQLMALLDSGISLADKAALDGIARNLSDACRILAKTVNGDAGDIQAGDDNRAAGDYSGAINHYKHAWQSGQ